MSFNTLGLRPELLSAITARGYETATPIQAQSIPKILEGCDLLAGAQTGTGKTAAFSLPVIQRLSERRKKCRNPRALILTPTRELAAQILDFVKHYSKGLSLRSSAIFGGVNIRPQIEALRRGVDVLVATPGRLLDHAGQKTIDLSHVEILVLDEADRMLDMGFIHDIKRIIALLPKKRQNLLFSATYSREIKNLSDGILVNPVHIEVAARNTAAETVCQAVYPVARGRKRELLSKLIREGQWTQTLVFARTKHGANRLAKQLLSDKISATAIHGNKSQAARMRALDDFKAGRMQVLVATDIAARGLDINLLPHVVNFELPDTPESYVHRIGRTGRAGREGKAISLVCPEEQKELRSIQGLLKRELPVEIIAGFDVDLASSVSQKDSSHQHRRPVRKKTGQFARLHKPKGNHRAKGEDKNTVRIRHDAPRMGAEPTAASGTRKSGNWGRRKVVPSVPSGNAGQRQFRTKPTRRRVSRVG